MPAPAGRIAHYIHTDRITEAKGGCLARVICDTDFAAKTPEFIAFADEVARLAYGSNSTTWEGIIITFPFMEDRRRDLAKLLKEKITITNIAIQMLV